jgi:CRP-like cAMP-binding protein
MTIGDQHGKETLVVRRLGALRPLSETARRAVADAICGRILKAAAGDDIVHEGACLNSVRLMLSGWACRYKLLEDGRRQIVGFILPGDTCDAYIYLLSGMDHAIAALTPVIYAELESACFEELTRRDKSVAEAMLCEMLVSNSIQREWSINLGRRDAFERVAHLFCELFERLRVVGLVKGNAFWFPVTQTDLADATGLSPVHLNRILQQLRNSGLIVLRDKTLTLHDFEMLCRAGMFNPAYLHLGRV